MKKINNKIPFQALHKGKCDTCKDHKLLDTMVMKNQTKGLYECIDCRVSEDKKTIEDYLSIINSDDKKEIKMSASKLKKVIKWIVG